MKVDHEYIVLDYYYMETGTNPYPAIMQIDPRTLGECVALVSGYKEKGWSGPYVICKLVPVIEELAP